MNKYINLYTGTVTAGGTDGTAVADDAPLSVELDATKDESKVVACAVRCEAGYQTVGDTVVTFDGTNKAKWSICDKADGTFSDSLTLKDTVTTKNILFYVKATSAKEEDPVNDTTVSVKLSTKIGAAA